MTPETDLHYTLIKFFSLNNESELSNILKQSKILYDKEWSFTGVISNQRKMTINIKSPIDYQFFLKEKLSILKKIIFEIYENDDDYMATEVKISVLASKVSSFEVEEIEKEIIEGSVYSDFIREITNMKLDKIEKDYLYEAAECGMRNNLLAASTMLGCAAEYLLNQICGAYLEYLKKYGTPVEVTQFEKTVVNAKVAFTRLDEFQKRVDSKSDLFKTFGFENPKLYFSYLDIIRKIRNEAGHPSGKIISENDLKMTFGNYSHLLKLSHNMIKELSKK